jgi:hypothetical protein
VTLVVDVTDLLSRFLFNRNDYWPGEKKVKPRAFERPPGDLGLSMFRTQDIEEDAIWILGASTRPDRSLKARADLVAGVVFEAKLHIDPDNTPPGHVHIVGWPTRDEDELDARKKLADAAELRIAP